MLLKAPKRNKKLAELIFHAWNMTKEREFIGNVKLAFLRGDIGLDVDDRLTFADTVRSYVQKYGSL